MFAAATSAYAAPSIERRYEQQELAQEPRFDVEQLAREFARARRRGPLKRLTSFLDLGAEIASNLDAQTGKCRSSHAELRLRARLDSRTFFRELARWKLLGHVTVDVDHCFAKCEFIDSDGKWPTFDECMKARRAKARLARGGRPARGRRERVESCRGHNGAADVSWHIPTRDELHRVLSGRIPTTREVQRHMREGREAAEARRAERNAACVSPGGARKAVKCGLLQTPRALNTTGLMSLREGCTS